MAEEETKVAHVPDSSSSRRLRQQLDAEMREEIKRFRDDIAELKFGLKEIKDYQALHADAVIAISTLVSTGVVVRYVVIGSIALLSMVGGINVAYEAIRKWFGHP